MVQFGAFWGLRRAFLINENPLSDLAEFQTTFFFTKKIFFCQNNVDSAAYSRIGSYAPALCTTVGLFWNNVFVLSYTYVYIGYMYTHSPTF